MTKLAMSAVATAVLGLAALQPSFVWGAEVTPATAATRPTQRGIVARVGWIGFAVSPDRRAFQSEAQVGGDAETNARNEARNECETAALRTCRAIAVVESADVSAVGCTYDGRLGAFIGGSTNNQEQRIALSKANERGFPDSSCVEFFRY